MLQGAGVGAVGASPVAMVQQPFIKALDQQIIRQNLLAAPQPAQRLAQPAQSLVNGFLGIRCLAGFPPGNGIQHHFGDHGVVQTDFVTAATRGPAVQGGDPAGAQVR